MTARRDVARRQRPADQGSDAWREVLAYVVREVHPRVSPTDVSYVEQTGDERVTLQTSTAPDETYPRSIVVATRSP